MMSKPKSLVKRPTPFDWSGVDAVDIFAAISSCGGVAYFTAVLAIRKFQRSLCEEWDSCLRCCDFVPRQLEHKVFSRKVDRKTQEAESLWVHNREDESGFDAMYAADESLLAPLRDSWLRRNPKPCPIDLPAAWKGICEIVIWEEHVLDSAWRPQVRQRTNLALRLSDSRSSCKEIDEWALWHLFEHPDCDREDVARAVGALLWLEKREVPWISPFGISPYGKSSDLMEAYDLTAVGYEEMALPARRGSLNAAATEKPVRTIELQELDDNTWLTSLCSQQKRQGVPSYMRNTYDNERS